MKKIIIITLCFAGLFSSCEDYLDVTPTNVVTLQTYKDVKDLMGACLSEYVQDSNIDNVEPHYANFQNYIKFIHYSGVIKDETYLLDPFGANHRGVFHQSLSWYEEGFHRNLWSDMYTSIGFYNTVIDELNKISDASEDEANIILGEAKYLRAWNLFKLLQYFSPYTNDELGIPVNFDSDAIGTYDSSRKTQTEVYDIIISELEEVLAYTTTPTEYNIFYDKKIVKALLATVYHFKAGSGAGVETDYDKAIDYATTALEGRNIAAISDVGDGDFLVIEDNGTFKDHPNALLVCVPHQNYSSNNSMASALFGIGWYGLRQYANDDLVSLYDDNDVRNGAYIDKPTGKINKFTFLPYEFRPYYFFRVADLKLIIAESHARKEEYGPAKIHLEEFQANRINGYAGYTGTDAEMLQEILDERTREFFGEYDMRWLDRIRTREGFTRPALDNDEIDTYTLEDDDYRLTQPIPVSEELENNKIPQNPGWNI